MNLQLKKSKRGKRVALEEKDDPELKRTKKVTSLEPEKSKETPSQPVIKIDANPEPDWESKDWYEHVDELPDDPDEDSYRELSVADFGAALRRGFGLPEAIEPETDKIKQQGTLDTRSVSQDYSGIGYTKPK